MSSDYGEQYESLLKPNKEFVRRDVSISSTTSRDLDSCFKVMLKEAVMEDKLVRQLGYTMLSAYTSNPINLAINAPSGEGKSHVLTTVGNLFPKTDVIYIAGMSSKAIFHKSGYIAIKDEDGEYVEVEDELEKLKETLPEKTSELSRMKKGDPSTPPDKIAELENEIDTDKQRKKEIEDNAVKVIELKNKILVFLDTPSSEIFEALMSLLSHDKYEVEYQFVDTSSRTGIKTRTNVLVGWPSVIFAQAIDYTNHPRYQEIQRRFIITNPRMDATKYNSAVDLIFEKNCNPDFVYQQKVVSDEEKDKAREIILNIKDDLLSFSTAAGKPGKNNTLIPFAHLLKKLIPKTNTAQDMTFTNRLLELTKLLANVYNKKRPYMEIIPAFSPDPLRIPMAIYSDMLESLSLLNNNVGGVRPYVLDWYDNVFLNLYDSKSDPNSKDKNGEKITEQRKGVTTTELIEKSHEVLNKPYTTKQILNEFIYPLYNLGYIDSIKSEIDKRAYIYFPAIKSTGDVGGSLMSKYSNLFLSDRKNKLFEDDTGNNVNIITIDDKTQIIFKINEIQRYYSENNHLVILKFADADTTMTELMEDITVDENDYKTVEEIFDKYYSEFIVKDSKFDSNNISGTDYTFIKSPALEEYLQTANNNDNLHDVLTDNIKNSNNNQDISNNLFHEDKKNKLIYSCYIAECNFKTIFEQEYKKHYVMNHPNKPAYPSSADIQKNGLRPQGKPWEV